MDHRNTAERTAKGLLLGIRKTIERAKLNKADFPRWVDGANIRIGKLDNSTLIFFDRAAEDEDEVIEYRDVDSDTEFYFPHLSSDCDSFALDIRREDNKSGFGSMSNLTMQVNGDHCLTSAGTGDHHISYLFYNMMLQYVEGNDPIAIRHIPFALYVPDRDIDLETLWEICGNSVVKTMTNLINTGIDGYRASPIGEKGIMANAQDTVIVLGSYDGTHEDELIQVRDYMRKLGYDSFLIKYLPSPAEQSLEEKVRLWTTASRFCVMVDREASGHIKEYEMVKDERKPLVLLRPEGGGSTWMIGDDEIVDLNYIRSFEFNDTPLEKLDEATQWVEDFLNERGKSYPEFYPWRDN